MGLCTKYDPKTGMIWTEPTGDALVEYRDYCRRADAGEMTKEEWDIALASEELYGIPLAQWYPVQYEAAVRKGWV